MGEGRVRALSFFSRGARVLAALVGALLASFFSSPLAGEGLGVRGHPAIELPKSRTSYIK
jgi:hypothetical protein